MWSQRPWSPRKEQGLDHERVESASREQRVRKSSEAPESSKNLGGRITDVHDSRSEKARLHQRRLQNAYQNEQGLHRPIKSNEQSNAASTSHPSLTISSLQTCMWLVHEQGGDQTLEGYCFGRFCSCTRFFTTISGKVSRWLIIPPPLLRFMHLCSSNLQVSEPIEYDQPRQATGSFENGSSTNWTR